MDPDRGELVLHMERVLVAFDSYPGFVQNGPEIAFTSLSFIICMHILILECSQVR